MTEGDLKTVKDLTTSVINEGVDKTFAIEMIGVENLKGEAIKYIKNCNKDLSFSGVFMRCSKGHRCRACHRFMKFFNIEEGDLNGNTQ